MMELAAILSEVGIALLAHETAASAKGRLRARGSAWQMLSDGAWNAFFRAFEGLCKRYTGDDEAWVKGLAEGTLRSPQERQRFREAVATEIARHGADVERQAELLAERVESAFLVGAPSEFADLVRRSLPDAYGKALVEEARVNGDFRRVLDTSLTLHIDARTRRIEGKLDRLTIEGRRQAQASIAGAEASEQDLTCEPMDFGPELRRLTKDFTGREWVGEELERWLRDPHGHAFVVVGEPGVGKSAIAAWLATTRQDMAAVHFCTTNDAETLDPHAFATSVAAQLCEAIPGYVEAIADREPTRQRETGTQAFRELIVEPTATLDPEAQWLLVVDSLDEATRQPGETVLDVISRQAGSLPSWLRVVTTTRPEGPIMQAIQHLDPFVLEAEEPRNLEDLRAYCEMRAGRAELAAVLEEAQVASEGFAQRVVEVSEGNFLVAGFILDEVERGNMGPGELQSLSGGMAAFYYAIFSRRFPDAGQFREGQLALLSVLNAAQAPMSFERLGEVLGWEELTLNDRLGEVQELLRIREGGHTLFHQSLRDWLSDREASGSYWCPARGGHERLGERLWGEYEGKELDEYALRYLVTHLAWAGMAERLEQALTDLSFVEEKCAAGLMYDLVGDYNLVNAGRGRPGPPIRTAWVHEGRLAVMCPFCLAWSEIKKEDLGEVIGCPACGSNLRLNAFVVEHEWHACAARREVAAREEPEVELSAAVDEFADFARAEAHVLAGRPELTLQQALNRPDGTAPAGRAAQVAEEERRAYIQWLNKPQWLDPCLATLEHGGWANACSFSPDGGRIVSGSDDGTVRVWDAESGEELGTFFPGASVETVAFDGAGRNLAAGGGRGILYRLRLEGFEFGPPILTGVRLWLFDHHDWDDTLTAMCPFHGGRFEVTETMLGEEVACPSAARPSSSTRSCVTTRTGTSSALSWETESMTLLVKGGI